MNYCEKFFYCLRTGKNSEARLLLAENPELTNLREDGNLTPLHVVARFGNTSLAPVLIDRGAHLEAMTQDTGSTPLKYAIFFAQLDMVKLLLKKGADVGNPGGGTRTPLELALGATTPMFREMGTPGSDLDYARIANILRSRSVRP